jgi:hypothetical protein
MNPLTALLLDSLLLGVILGLGYLLARGLMGPTQPLLSLAAAFPLGAGLWTWQVFLLSWAGLDNLRLAVWLAGGALLLGGVALNRMPKRARPAAGVSHAGRRLAPGRSTFLVRGLWALLGAIAIYWLVLAVGRAYSTWDAAAFWSIKGYGMALENSYFAAQNWGAHGLDYPLNIPLTVSMFKMLSGDPLPGSKMLFPLYFLSALAGCYAFWRSRGLSPLGAGCGLLFLATVPLLAEHATIGYSNMATAAYLLLALLVAAGGLEAGERGALLVSGMLLGLLAWTRPEGILFSLLGLGAILLARRSGNARRALMLPLVGPILLIAGAWFTFYFLYGGGESQAAGGVSAALASFLRGELRLSALILIARRLAKSVLSFELWGLAFPLSALFVLTHLPMRSRRAQPQAWSLLMASAGAILLTVGLFYIGQFQFSPQFLGGWLDRGFDRALLPAVVLMIAGVVGLLGRGEPEAGDEGFALTA